MALASRTVGSGSELALTEAEAKVLELKLLSAVEAQADEQQTPAAGVTLVSEGVFCEEVPRELQHIVESLAEMEPELLKAQGISAHRIRVVRPCFATTRTAFDSFSFLSV